MADNADDLLQRFDKLRVWRKFDQRAPHKPLLALWAIAQCLRDEPRLAHCESVESEMIRLLGLFGPHRKRANWSLPFWHMRNDGVWQIDRPDLVGRTGSGSALVSDLRRHNIRGGLTESDYDQFQSQPVLAWQVVHSLLETHFPPTLHEDILRAVGFPNNLTPEAALLRERTVRYLPRDSSFRARVLDAYDGRCAVCRLSLQLMKEPVEMVEAAHIRWHASNGPPDVCNGIALCVLHHKLFDLGAFTVLEDLRVCVSPYIQGTGREETIGRFDGEPLQVPSQLNAACLPAPRYLTWHRREVFKGYP